MLEIQINLNSVKQIFQLAFLFQIKITKMSIVAIVRTLNRFNLL